jgi:hypothetical protein
MSGAAEFIFCTIFVQQLVFQTHLKCRLLLAVEILHAASGKVDKDGKRRCVGVSSALKHSQPRTYAILLLALLEETFF